MEATSTAISFSSEGESKSSRPVPRLPVLDGWRGISILAVLMAHLAPLGPKRFQFNTATGLFGMALFFTLSGFLITTTLYFHPSVKDFIIRRLLRILPAAFLYIGLVLTFLHAPLKVWIAHIFFYENLPPFFLTDYTSNFWSLCVEMQFYLGIAVIFWLFRERGLALLPVFCLAITLNRVHARAPFSIITIYRVDEILSGATLAWLFHGRHAVQIRRILSCINPFIPLIMLGLSCIPYFPWLNYLRPYFASILVGTTIATNKRNRWNLFLKSRPLSYLATISYALYVWNEMINHGWFISGTKFMKYAKRPLGIGLNFVIAHLSTFYFEKYWINLAKRMTQPSR